MTNSEFVQQPVEPPPVTFPDGSRRFFNPDGRARYQETPDGTKTWYSEGAVSKIVQPSGEELYFILGRRVSKEEWLTTNTNSSSST